MVRELERTRHHSDFPETAPAANPVFFRTYSRRQDEGRETWEQVCDRTIAGLEKLGNLNSDEVALLTQMQKQLKTLSSGRWLWVGGTDWIERPENFSGAYNCSSTNIHDWRAFGLLMGLAMMGCGTGAVLEPQYINQLPKIRNRLQITLQGEIGMTPSDRRRQETAVTYDGDRVLMNVGDSRIGWVQSYQTLLELSTDERFNSTVEVVVDLCDIRPAGEPLKGFGGVANPVKLTDLYKRVALILNKANGRQLNSVECCLLIDEAASTIVAGNIRRSAGMRQSASDDELFANAKMNLWQQDEAGNWRIDPERDALRMANHTRVFHHKPTLTECIDAVRQQYYSGEGAIQWAGEAVARASCDLMPDRETKRDFLKAYNEGKGKQWIGDRYPEISQPELEHRLSRVGLNPCGEIIGADFHCVSGDTMLVTRDGMHSIRSLVGQSVEIWNGQRWSRVTPMLTGRDRRLYQVSFADGTWLDVTEKHRFFVKDRFGKTYLEMTTAQLQEHLSIHKYALHTEPFQIDYQDGKFVDPLWAYTLGQLVGDGSLCQSHGKPQLQLRLYGAKSYQELALAGRTSGKLRYYAENPETPCLLYTGFQGQFDPEEVRDLKANATALEALASWNREGILHFIAGLIDSDGSATSSGGVRLYLSDYNRAYRVYLLLLKCGIRSSINLQSRAGEITNLGIRNKDLWYLQITDCAAIPCQRVNTSKGHHPTTKGKWQVIREIVPIQGHHDTFCFNEPEFHKGVFGGTLTGQCNLAEIHLNQIDPKNDREQADAFAAGALSVATLLNHKFVEPRYQYSREIDPIVGVSFTGLFDFFVHAFGVDWLRWWEQGRPATPEGIEFKRQEEAYLTRWRTVVHEKVWDYCDRHGLRRPNRCTTVQPSGTKSLLTGASPGWHPPKAQRFIRRITFGKNDPVALACIDYGYSVIPSQSDKDENGNLLNDPFDPRCSEWLVEIPIAVSWADLPGADEIDISQFSAMAQMDFYMNVQSHYVTHNTSATVEVRESEIELLGTRIYEAIQNDEGYISAALLARFDDRQSFPRLPFEPIDKAEYDRLSAEVLVRRKTDDFKNALQRYDLGELAEAGPAGCDSDKCLLPEKNPS
ncbi:ribonucleoside-triphosphate reductase, adenosylcobalamin-dependent [Laspinema sp. A4]|uniref:ribonucleoside-triphosphate reductase, adenosylcobalamin-dependent n=1 Tax=Laspinema sp. D2d TaxID=2953686 RepID=UPI0021BA6CEF|nr:ribonucleoside-triphosphate reductase, adenosylcobalamin-dependent [Laspinema sp. D2d]MCT7986556.1 ribonucleoside-triphosphate reductase, adenosylcobalamin-dependent [Laspinema sp. D2d]